ncbi:MAG: hypothetical protein R3C03_12785 [Pirellulaceae bacterium]
MTNIDGLNDQFMNFSQWLPGAIGIFLALVLALSLIGVFFGFLVATYRHGPGEGFYIVAQTIGQSIPDFFGTSPRRVMAIARLAVKESIRRRVVMVTFGVFALALLFGGWFMNSGTDHPDRVYVNFVSFGTQMLILLMGVLVASFSLPDDIKNKTIYTVVTKPVRATEIVIGRVVGFMLIGTTLLAIMGLLSYLFVIRGLAHTHQVVGETQSVLSLNDIDPATRLNQLGRRVSASAVKEGMTTFDDGHRHPIELIEDIRDPDSLPFNPENVVSKEVLPDGRIRYLRLIVEEVSGHTHNVKIDGQGDDARFTLSNSKGYFKARVPMYAQDLIFYDSTGAEKEGGINIGKEAQVRGYIDGGSYANRNTLSNAQFVFENFDAARFDNAEDLVLELTLGVFRSTKGDIQRRVLASMQFESIPDNPEIDSKFVSDKIIFETEEYRVQIRSIPRKQSGQLIDRDGNAKTGTFDLFDDFAANGKVKLIIRCEDQNQFLGMSRSDVYFRQSERSYGWNFFKAFVGIWAQMLIVVSIAVALSTFLSAPVTIVGTVVLIVIGFNSQFIRNMMEPENSGGGPIESFYRIVTQKNMEIDLEASVATTLLEQTDILLVKMLTSLTYIAPDFSSLNFSQLLSLGYSIRVDNIFVALLIALGFFVGFSVLGYFSLKTREIAK